MKIKEIRNLSIKTEQLKELFLNYPFKDFQQRIQGLDKNRLADFFTKELFNKICGDVDFLCFTIEDNGNLIALFGIEPLKKQSQIYGKTMFQISNYLNYREDESFNIFWANFQKIIHDCGIKYISCRLDASDYRNISILTACGFRYAGISVKLALSLDRYFLSRCDEFFSLRHNKENHMQIVSVGSNDMPAVLKIATQHKYNHYFYDNSLDKNKTERLFSEWVSDFARKNNSGIYILKEKATDEVIGFASYLEPIPFNRALNKKIIMLDFVAIDKKFQNKNFGTKLLFSTLGTMSNAFNDVELRVASDNYPALNLYAKLGFRIIGGDVYLSYSA